MRNEPGNGSVMSNARVTIHTSPAPRIQMGKDHKAASTNGRGCRVTARPLLNRLAVAREAAAQRRRQDAGGRQRSACPIRSGCDATIHSSTSSDGGDGRGDRRRTPRSIAARATTSCPCRRSRTRRPRAAAARPPDRARARSRWWPWWPSTLSPSWRASRYGRSTSPARAGSTASAANPITVARNVERKRVGPIGVEQVLPANGPGPVRRRRRRPAPSSSNGAFARRT